MTTQSVHVDEPFPISVVVITHNEEVNVGRCLDALHWCDERVVIDDHSTDSTREIAERCGARVVQHRFESFAAQRNYALDECGLRNEWVLMLDADEVMTGELRQQIEERLPASTEDVVGYRLCRKTIYLDSWLKYSDGFPVWIMRIVRRDGPRFADHGHGEVSVPQVDGDLPMLSEPFLHFPFSRGIGDWVTRHVGYASREAELERQLVADWRWDELWSKDRSVRRKAQRALSRRLPMRPLLRFCYQYFFKLGVLDGRGGIVFSCLMAFYEGMIVLKRDELAGESKT